MTPTSGTISLGDIRTELGLSGAISLNDSFVRKCLFVTSGAISIADGRAVTLQNIADAAVSTGISISNATANQKYTLYLSNTSGWYYKYPVASNQDATINVNLGTGSKFLLINNGVLWGCGGIGGKGGDCTTNTPQNGTAGGAGGYALRVLNSIPYTIENNNTMFSGAGGGGGGGGASNATYSYRCSGGGGGGGNAGGTGGNPGAVAGTYIASGGAGTPTTTSYGGGGYPGQLYSNYVRAGGGGAGGFFFDTGGVGWSGGNGLYGTNLATGGAGGASGTIINGAGTVTWSVAGTRNGTIGP